MVKKSMGQVEVIAPRYKRPFDLTILLTAHLLALPIWALLWIGIPILIVLSDGFPVFYRQERIGRKGRFFYAFKFRTMVKNADVVGPPWTVPDDPRLTRVGRLLRKTALDELPQVINILKGEMSFVGPRPLDKQEHQNLCQQIPGFEKRLDLYPGLTGLAQIYTNREDSESKLFYDLKYASQMSLLLDVKLIFQSVWVTLRARWERQRNQLKGKR